MVLGWWAGIMDWKLGYLGDCTDWWFADADGTDWWFHEGAWDLGLDVEGGVGGDGDRVGV